MLKLNNLSSNPKKEIYEKVKTNLNTLIQNSLEEINAENGDVRTKVQDTSNTIHENNQKISERAKKDQITKRKVQNFFIIVACFLLFGFFFLKTYKANKLVIKEYKEYAAGLMDNNKELEIKNQNLIANYSSDFSLMELVKKTLNQLNVPVIDEVNQKEIIFSNPKFNQGYVDGIFKTRIRDNFVLQWDSTSYFLMPVTTSNSKSFSYTVVVTDSEGRSKRVTKWKTVTAYHDELTPFADRVNNFLFKSNFLPELEFETLATKKKFYKFENNKFSKKFRIVGIGNPSNPDPNSVETSQKLLQFFTPKAQEMWLDWVETEIINDPKIYKTDKGLLIKTRTTSNCQEFNSDFSINPLLNQFNTSRLSLQDIEARVVNWVQNFIMAYFFKLMYAIMIPGFSREKYQSNGQYLVSEAVNEEKDVEVENSINNFVKHINIINNPNITFSIKHKVTKKPVFNCDNLSVEDEIYNYEFNYMAHWSELLVEVVVVYDPDCGACHIPVQYERFYQFNEKKNLLFIQINSQTIDYTNSERMFEIMVTNLFARRFGNANFNKIDGGLLASSGVWIGRKKYFENRNNSQKMVDQLLEFDKFNNELKNTLGLTINSYGVWCVINVPELLDEAALRKLKEFLREFAQMAAVTDK